MWILLCGGLGVGLGGFTEESVSGLGASLVVSHRLVVRDKKGGV